MMITKTTRKYVIIMDIEQEIVYYKHKEKIWGKSAMFGNIFKNLKGCMCKLYLVGRDVSAWNIETPIAAQLYTHMPLYIPLRPGYGKCPQLPLNNCPK